MIAHPEVKEKMLTNTYSSVAFKHDSSDELLGDIT